MRVQIFQLSSRQVFLICLIFTMAMFVVYLWQIQNMGLTILLKHQGVKYLAKMNRMVEFHDALDQSPLLSKKSEFFNKRYESINFYGNQQRLHYLFWKIFNGLQKEVKILITGGSISCQHYIQVQIKKKNIPYSLN